MARKLYRAQVTQMVTLASGIVRLIFKPQVAFKFEAGQFVSLKVPDKNDAGESVWRAYSLAVPYEIAREHGYELCIKKLPGGQAGAYLERLKVGDWIEVRVPYGIFTFKNNHGRPVVFISTGTGIAPLRSIALSEEFQQASPPFAIAMLGFRSLDEVPYVGDFERVGVSTRYALSTEKRAVEDPFVHGRVTDVLKGMKSDFPWTQCDYYLCGNAHMIHDVVSFLKTRGVRESAIFAEAFEPASNLSDRRVG